VESAPRTEGDYTSARADPQTVSAGAFCLLLCRRAGGFRRPVEQL